LRHMNLKKTVSMAKTAPMTISITSIDRCIETPEEVRGRSFELAENWALVLRGHFEL
jgi:hypothetical protein